MSGPLTGVKIVDLSSVISGPVATVLLADQGAEVIKIEPLQGDIVRHMGNGENGMSAGFLTANRGKKSIALDLKTAAGVAIVKDLVRDADVFVQNFRPGAVERMGLGEAAIRAIKPDIIYVSISGFGDTGPYAHKRVYDPVIQALSGLTDIQAEGSDARPKMIRTIIPDKTTALTASQAITAALFARERSGEGQAITLAMIDATIAYLWAEGMAGLSLVGQEKHVRRGQLAQDLVFQTQDGYITAGAVSNAEWVGMCKVLNKPEWLDDPRFNQPGVRMRNAPERLALTSAELIKRTSAEWLELLDAAGVPCAPILSRQEIVDNEQIKNNDLLNEYDHPGMGRVRQPRAAAQFSRTKTNREQLAPALGEHSRTILKAAGRTDEEISQLVAAGVVGVASS
jgi:crotonobetainyl-CoA:carnitine CoA-transferase CaiB-like acyl-CoA transferase